MLVASITTPTRELAEAIATALVERRLAACAQVAGPIRSLYRWQGKVESADEWLVTAKTGPDRWDALCAAVVSLHSYETPEVIATPVTHALPAYAAWVADALAPET
ncbi:MAG: divalent-cation tolerance protein CutA [Lacipirellulaceae bacterium]